MTTVETAGAPSGVPAILPPGLSVDLGNATPRLRAEVGTRPHFPGEKTNRRYARFSYDSAGYASALVWLKHAQQTPRAAPVDPTTRDFQRFRSDFDDPGPRPGTRRFLKHSRKWQRLAGRHWRLQQALRITGRLEPGDEVKIATDSDSVICGKACVMHLTREYGDGPVGRIFCERISPEARRLITYTLGIPVIIVDLDTVEREASEAA